MVFLTLIGLNMHAASLQNRWDEKDKLVSQACHHTLPGSSWAPVSLGLAQREAILLGALCFLLSLMELCSLQSLSLRNGGQGAAGLQVLRLSEQIASVSFVE